MRLSLETSVLAASISAAIIFLFSIPEPPNIRRTILKTASTTLLSIATYIRGNPLSLVCALGLGSAGDGFLAASDGDVAFLCGLGSFLAAHVIYIALFLHLGNGAAYIVSEGWRTSTAGFMVVLAAGMTATLWPRVEEKLRIPIAIYAVTILGMVSAALTVDQMMIVQGALLFAASDSILAAEKFLVSPQSRYRPLMQYSLWILYYTGQFRIASGVQG